MANEKVTLLDLSFNTGEASAGLDDLIAKSTELASKKAQLSKALKDEQASISAASKAYREGQMSQESYNATLDKSSKSQVALKKQLLETNNSIKENNADIKTNTTLLTSQADSVNALRAQLAANTKELNAMSAAERMGSEAGQKLSAETKGISDRLKEMETSIGDNRRNVGNYSESIVEAMGSTKGLSGATAALTQGFAGSISVARTFNAVLKANPILAIVSVVLILISTVEKLMKRNSEMATSLKAAFAPFQVIFDRILDGITELLEGVAKAIEWVSENVVKLLDKLGLISEETKKAAASARELAKAEYDIYAQETNNLVVVSAMKREMEQLKNLGADQTKSTIERKEAMEQSLNVLKQMEKEEVSLLQAKYDQIKAQNELSYTSQEDARKEAEALAALQEKQASYATQQKEIIGQISGLQVAEQAKQASAAQAAIAKRRAAEVEAARKTEEERRMLQEETIKLMSDNLVALELHLREAEMNDESTKLKIENQKKYNEESLKLERYRLEQGLISVQEYSNLETEYRLGVEEMNRQRELEAEDMNRERLAVDAANRQELAMLNATNEFDLRQMMLDAQYEQEMANAERTGADTALITEKYEKAKELMAKARLNATLEMSSSLAGQMSSLLGEESAAGKAFAVAQATINTYLGATKAIATGGFAGIAQAAIVIAFGLKQVASIVKTKEPETRINSSVKKFAKGGQIYGASHAQGGVTFHGSNGQVFEAEGGENVYIMKKTASAEISALSAFNQQFGGNSFGTSGLYKFAEGGQVASLSNSSNMTYGDSTVILSNDSINKIADVVITAVSNMPNPVVSVQDINSGMNDVSVTRNSAAY